SSDPDYLVATSDLDDDAATAVHQSHADAAAVALPKRPDAEGFVSFLRSPDDVDAVCKKYGVPEDHYTARLAGDLRACSPPPPGCVCVYAHALEAGMRVPLHPFFCEALAHFGVAPTQLAPNAWRIMAGFLVLCRSAGVPPSLAVFRRFFVLSVLNHRHTKRWYYFQTRFRDSSGLRFAGLPDSINGWKRGFFFLSSPTPWPCPVEWGEPSKSSFVDPVLTNEEKKSVAKLLRASGGAAVDIRTCLSDSNIAATVAGRWMGGREMRSHDSTMSLGMDPPARDMTDSMPAEKTAAPAARTGQVKREAHGDTLPLSGKKRRREEVTATDGHDGAAPVSNPRAPPGFDPRSPHSAVPDTLDWKAVQKILEGLVTPSRERHFAASKPSDLLASSYVAVLQAANYATFSTSYALELDEKVLACERDNLALWEQVEKEKAARQAAEAELEKVKAELESAEATAVQQFLGSEEYTRRLAEHALPAYLRGAEEMRRVVLRHYPHVDAGKLELPLD
uniref:Transposase (putative) gypsy type domain-containing protein n=1 Tax=Aegilops tauschii subsp. strangulata TaxID=200361 RepID=A0A453QW46_AEGTS